jgi:hypothetical protein
VIDRPRAISLSRPWSELVVAGIKPVENRTWRAGHRGLLVIHAAQSFDPEALMLAADLEPAGEQRLAQVLRRDLPPPTGYVGVVDLIDVCSAARWADEVRCACGPWAQPRQHHWQLARARRFAAPIAGRGLPGIWRVVNPVVDAAIASSTRIL